MARPPRRRSKPVEAPEVEVAEIEAVLDAANIEEITEGFGSTLQPPQYPVLSRRQRVVIDLRSDASTLSLNITGPSLIEISG